MTRPYLDLSLVIARESDHYQAHLTSAAGGEGSVSSAFARPLSALEMENFRLRMARGAQLRSMAAGDSDLARGVGSRLFEAVFRGDLLTKLTADLQAAHRSGAGLRVRLSNPPELSDLPWEFLYSPDLGRFLSVSSETPIVRYLDLGEQVEPLPVTPPLRVLAMVASPTDYPQLQTEREYQQLREALAAVERRGLVAVERTSDGSLAALQGRLRRGKYHIVHFVGHGKYDERVQEGTLIVEGPDRRAVAIGADKFGALLHDHQTLRLVILNACEGGRGSTTDAYAGVAQSLVRAQIPAVIAMQAEISDDAATTFAREFYGALADGFPVDAALGEARKALFTETNGLEWGTPVLYTRSATTALFDLAARDQTHDSAQIRIAAEAPAPPPAITPPVDVPKAGGPLSRPGGLLVVPVAERMPEETSAAPSRRVITGWALIAAVFLANLAETAWETHTVTSRAVFEASAMQWLERGYQFNNPEVVSTLVIRGYSIAYFFLFPVMALAIGVVLARGQRPEQFHRLALALTFDYLISLPFFLAFPVPERWAYPESRAILLPDLWSSELIEAFRPASALDNCFPSFHTSMTVVLVLCCWLAGVRLRRSVIPLGAMIIVSTFALGIHWMGDVLAGTSVGVISVALAVRAVSAPTPTPLVAA